jgi:hypothetical protein
LDKFNLKFQGEILPGRDPAEVKQLFAREFYIDNPNRVEAFFSGREIILRRNLEKDEAAKVFVALRKIGVVTHIVKVEPIAEPTQESVPAPKARQEPPVGSPAKARQAVSETPKPASAHRTAIPAAAESAAATATAEKTATDEAVKPRRKRQPGAPNMFDLRKSDRSLRDKLAGDSSEVLTRAPIIAAAIVLLAFLLVGARFWSQSQSEAPAGLGLLAVSPGQQPLVQSGDQLLLHDRAGLSTFRLPLAELDIGSAAALDYFSNGDLAVLQAETRGAGWLGKLLGRAEEPASKLLRCQIKKRKCSALASGIGAADFIVDRRNNEIYLADASTDRLQKLDAAGTVLAEKPLELSDPVHLRLQEGILYLTQWGSDTVTIMKPDEREFGRLLDQISLAVDGASQSGHIFPADLLFVNESWWAIMQSRDGSTAGLYKFSPRWKFEQAIPLPAGALPGALTLWGNKVLVTDREQQLIYRFDATAQQERDFSSEFLELSLGERSNQLSRAESLRAFILVILFGAAAGLLALGVLQSMRGKIYTHPEDNADAGFDINNDAIEWLDPAPQVDKRLRQVGYAIAATAVIFLLGAFVAQLSVWGLLAIILMLAGLGGLYYALLRSSGCHLGLLNDRLILVDHTNTYRVGSGPKIQYFKNYVMIDDVIVYLGNPVVAQFAHEALEKKFQPLFNTGIKVDRTTLRVKLIQSRHPMWLGASGFAAALFCALVLILVP